MDPAEPMLDLDTLPVIGIGRMATVYVLRPSPSAAPIALKVFPKPMDRFTRAAFDRERAALGTLPQVSSILRVDSVLAGSDGRPGLGMELCEQSLWELVQAHGPLSLPDALAIGQSVATALAAAAEVGVGHGAVTPHNVLLRVDGEPVLADFGLALRRSYAGDAAYAQQWAAPETVRDNAFSMQADLYGLGAVLYLALTGGAPLVDRTASPEQLDLPEPVRGLLTALLAQDPADRPGDAGTVLAQLVALLEFAAGPATPIATPQAAAGDFDDFPDDSDRASLAEVADSFFTEWPSPDQPNPGVEVTQSPEQPSSSAEPNRPRLGRVVGAVAALAVLVAVPVIAGQQPAVSSQPAPLSQATPHLSQPTPQPVGPASPDTSSAAEHARSIDLVLAAPVDRGDTVDLSWSGATDLRYAVVVAGASLPTKVIFVNDRQRSLRIPIDPARQYCFLVQGTDGRQVYQTAPKAIRNAACRL